jgi:hypothetical protein
MNKILQNLKNNPWLRILFDFTIFIIIYVTLYNNRAVLLNNYEETHNKTYLIYAIILSIMLFMWFIFY